jgi:hypothetical protein
MVRSAGCGVRGARCEMRGAGWCAVVRNGEKENGRPEAAVHSSYVVSGFSLTARRTSWSSLPPRGAYSP